MPLPAESAPGVCAEPDPATRDFIFNQTMLRFEVLSVEVVKPPDDRRMKGLAFIRDPDGYWVEILAAGNMRF